MKKYLRISSAAVVIGTLRVNTLKNRQIFESGSRVRNAIAVMPNFH